VGVAFRSLRWRLKVGVNISEKVNNIVCASFGFEDGNRVVCVCVCLMHVGFDPQRFFPKK
jgi:hypothetical protein